MGISVAELVSRYPVLYHMASFGSWPSIQRHGLLSTTALLDLFEVAEPRRTELVTSQRHHSELLSHNAYGTAFLRDQKPLSDKNLARCLIGCDSATWYRTLNERVFFWLDRQRLVTLMSAREYIGKSHTVLELRSADFVPDYLDRIELSHMNTGNARPYPHPRGPSTFLKLEDYPYEKRRQRSNYSAIVELTVIRGVQDVREYVSKAEHATVRNGRYCTAECLFASYA